MARGVQVLYRVATPEEATEWINDRVADVLREHCRAEDIDARNLFPMILSLTPELQARGVHIEPVPTGGVQFAAFATVTDLKRQWMPDATDEAFEALLRDVPNINLLTLEIGGRAVRCAEPFVPVEVVR